MDVKGFLTEPASDEDFKTMIGPNSWPYEDSFFEFLKEKADVESSSNSPIGIKQFGKTIGDVMMYWFSNFPANTTALIEAKSIITLQTIE